jgi:CubicO group peptidase (beta-lactamase class C family)
MNGRETSAAMERRLDAAIARAIGEKRIVGAVVLVAGGGRLLYRRAAGFADREAGRAMAEDAIFRLASVTKPLVTSLAMQLVEEGRIRLEDPVSRYLPQFRPRLADASEPVITLRNLVLHTAGLSYRFQEPPGSAYHALDVSDGFDRAGVALAENLRRLAAAPLRFAPGERWLYSLATDVLGAVIEAVLETKLADAVRARITAPLGMADTGFRVVDPVRLAVAYADGRPEPVAMSDATALPYLEGVVRFAPGAIFHPGSYASGGAGMAGTAGDFLLFLEAIRSGGAPILGSGTVAEMMRDHVGPEAEALGPGWGFGYGWAVLADEAAACSPQSPGTIQWGGVYGHSWFVDPARALSVVAFTNTALEGDTGAFPGEIRDAVYG